MVEKFTIIAPVLRLSKLVYLMAVELIFMIFLYQWLVAFFWSWSVKYEIEKKKKKNKEGVCAEHKMNSILVW